MKKRLLKNIAKFLCVTLLMAVMPMVVMAEDITVPDISGAVTKIRFENLDQGNISIGSQKAIADVAAGDAATGSWTLEQLDNRKAIKYTMPTASKFYYLEFAVNVETAGYYAVAMASTKSLGKQMSVMVDGVPCQSIAPRPEIDYAEYPFGSAYMSVGKHNVRVVMFSTTANYISILDYITFTANVISDYYTPTLTKTDASTASITPGAAQKGHIASVIKNMVKGDSVDMTFTVPSLSVYNIGLYSIKAGSWTVETVDVYVDNKLVKENWQYTESRKTELATGIQLDGGAHTLSFKKETETTGNVMWLCEAYITICSINDLLATIPEITSSANTEAQSQVIEFENMTGADSAYLMVGGEGAEEKVKRGDDFVYVINGNSPTELSFENDFPGNYDIFVTYKTPDLTAELGADVVAGSNNRLEATFKINGTDMGNTYFHNGSTAGYAAINTAYTKNIGSTYLGKGANVIEISDTVDQARYMVLDKIEITPSENTTAIASKLNVTKNADIADSYLATAIINNNVSDEAEKYVLINPKPTAVDAPAIDGNYYAVFDVQMPSAGTYDVTIESMMRYKNGGIYDIYMNDILIAENFEFTDDGKDKTFVTTKLGSASMSAGTNKVKFVLKGSVSNNYQCGVKMITLTRTDVKTSIDVDGRYYAYTHLKNGSEVSKPAVIIFAHYIEDEAGLLILENISFRNENIASGADVKAITPLDISLKNGKNVFKIYVWDSVEGILPITSVNEMVVQK